MVRFQTLSVKLLQANGYPDMLMSDIKVTSEIQEVISSGQILNVLIVDDSKTMRSAIRETLELGNVQVTEASNGKDALELIYNNVPDLVLLDVVMPDMDGISVLKTLRKSYSKLQLPVVLVTSLGASSEIIQALDFGANDYITKPVDFDVLWARVSNQLMQKQTAEYLRLAQNNLEKQVKQRTAELNSSNQQLKKEIEVRLLAEGRLQKQASYDELTGLPNRSLAKDRLYQTILKSKRHHLQPCLAFLDLDNFKYINDTFGHAAGDELLREASRRLTDCARGSDTVARLGGDEFLLILEDDRTGKEQQREIGIRHIGERIIASFSKPFVIEGHKLNVTASLGFAIYPQDGDDSNKLMRHADVAMYRSKNEGKNTFCFYSPEMSAKAIMRMNVESELRQAIENREFTLHYQPIVDSKTGSIAKAEALLRWDCKKLGMITPDYFIPIAEETGLIISIGEWVIETACKQMKQWRDDGWKNVCITINVSARQFQSNSLLVKTIKRSLQKNDLSSNAIQLELTEGVLMKETDESIETMAQLGKMGIKLLIDDFGTGYASLSYLQRYNFDSIKIDRSYISNVLISKQDKKLVKAVIAMAKSLGMSVVSEGVESKGQLDFLIKENCEFIQGYYFSKPVPSDEFYALLKKMNELKNSIKSLKIVSGAH
ncbi:diguanylate cyclase/phosphodiesterase (GGDEF & EAL domains) with PAS/PAC sensor(s) [hydrothermal vent metagenome]|uniref:Diguanylate cyclase/phosphodiesterase (GGDEF & EAL domains) with PAS/PAC sensor(S) n=1 Tax=hydrothermal vent metagenome TaxID=652676 RepID=A0A3B0WAS4_9ZZZZ